MESRGLHDLAAHHGRTSVGGRGGNRPRRERRLPQQCGTHERSHRVIREIDAFSRPQWLLVLVKGQRINDGTTTTMLSGELPRDCNYESRDWSAPFRKAWCSRPSDRSINGPLRSRRVCHWLRIGDEKDPWGFFWKLGFHLELESFQAFRATRPSPSVGHFSDLRNPLLGDSNRICRFSFLQTANPP